MEGDSVEAHHPGRRVTVNGVSMLVVDDCEAGSGA
jgi:hypothetical protein